MHGVFELTSDFCVSHGYPYARYGCVGIHRNTIGVWVARGAVLVFVRARHKCRGYLCTRKDEAESASARTRDKIWNNSSCRQYYNVGAYRLSHTAQWSRAIVIPFFLYTFFFSCFCLLAHTEWIVLLLPLPPPLVLVLPCVVYKYIYNFFGWKNENSHDGSCAMTLGIDGFHIQRCVRATMLFIVNVWVKRLARSRSHWIVMYTSACDARFNSCECSMLLHQAKLPNWALIHTGHVKVKTQWLLRYVPVIGDSTIWTIKMYGTKSTWNKCKIINVR